MLKLDYILKFIKGKGLLILPTFYMVDPSDLRHHTSSFGEALANHDKKFNTNEETFRCNVNMDKLETWKMALHQVANLLATISNMGTLPRQSFILF